MQEACTGPESELGLWGQDLWSLGDPENSLDGKGVGLGGHLPFDPVDTSSHGKGHG